MVICEKAGVNITTLEFLKIRGAYWKASTEHDEKFKADLKEKVLEYNDNLVKMYPFLELRDIWDNPSPQGNLDTWLDDMPGGWRVAFGNKMCEEIKQALIVEGDEKLLNEYRLLQIKEKFGTLRWYTNWTTNEIEDIVHKYEDLSWNTCIECGKPSKYHSIGWIAPYCEECANKIWEKHKQRYPYIKFNQTFSDIDEEGGEFNETIS